MIKDYKGEMPKNVTTPDKAKAKKPFYKDWKFWVLTGLMTLFGACSVYGLVLGSQYVKAIERASHIIADAQDGKSEGLSKTRKMAYPSTGNAVGFNVSGIATYNSPYYIDLSTGNQYGTMATLPNNVPYCYYYNRIMFGFKFNGEPNSLNRSTFRLHFLSYNFTGVAINDWLNSVSGDNQYAQMNVATGETYTLQGYFVFDLPAYYEERGYNSGYQEGYEDGYQEGYSEGSDAINVPQSLKVLLPVGNQYSVQYSSYVDGVLDQQGQINSSESAGAWALFTRSRNQKLRVDLTLPVDSKAFWDFRSGWTSGTEVAGDYIALQQSWAVDGVTYLPTWVGEPQLFVSVVGTDVPDLTYRTISIGFDVAHWGDIKVGAYQQGYQQGYVDGQENPTVYDSGYDAGYADGQAQGETDGFNRGVAVGSSGSQSLAMMFKTAFQLPFDQLYRFLNFNLLGINFLALFTALISVSIGIMVIKKVL